MINLMILYVLLRRDFTMYSIRKFILEYFSPFTFPSFGAIKPALTKLEKNGYIASSKIMSDGGKLSIFYSITDDGLKKMRQILISPMSDNPAAFVSESKIKLCCAGFLSQDDKKIMINEIKLKANIFKTKANNKMKDDYCQMDYYQKIVFDNTVCEYNNYLTMLEGLDKE